MGLSADLATLEEESVYIIREVAGDFAKPALLYSIGKDSSVLLRLAMKAFRPAKPPFVLLHIDTTYKFPEMLEFRDRIAREHGLELLVHTNRDAVAFGANPFRLGTYKCCQLLKTTALLEAIHQYKIDAAIGGARREEEKSRAKERIYSLRDKNGQWDPKNQRPELWNLFNARIAKGESMRVFPLSNWTELDVWQYIAAENIPVVPLYFAQPRNVLVRQGILMPLDHQILPEPGDRIETVMCRMRSLGCTYCTGAIRSEARNVTEVVEELLTFRRSERENRAIDYDQEGSMELKKREGYF